MHGRPFYAWKEVLRLEGRLSGPAAECVQIWDCDKCIKSPIQRILDVASRTISRKIISVSQQSQTTYSTN
jgi:hypothetical protein